MDLSIHQFEGCAFKDLKSGKREMLCMVTGERFAFCVLNCIIFCVHANEDPRAAWGSSMSPSILGAPGIKPRWSGLDSRLLYPLSHMKAPEWVKISTHREI